MLAEQAGDMLSGGARVSSSVEGISISTIGLDDQPFSRASAWARSI
jgi:hypothetical protein